MSVSLKVLGSGSSGSCYVLDCENEALILEAGVSFQKVKKALDFNLRKVVGCVVTHEHGDHAKYIKSMVDSGFYTLALPEVWAAKGIESTRSISLELGRGYKFGNFKVLPFGACHDVPCVGYLIDHPQSGKIMFLTDSCSCDYRFKDLSHILIECNYSHKKLSEAISVGRTMPQQRERLMRSHMELGTCKEVLATTDLSMVGNIVLIHMSDNNADEEHFISEVEKATGRIVYAARPGLTISLDRI